MPDRKIKKKPRVAIVGTGRLGTALAVSLAARGYSIEALVARRLESARKAATLVRKTASAFDTEIVALAARQMRSLPPAELFLITVPDDQIATVAAALAKLNFARKPAALHTSGALSATVLSPLADAGWSTGSVHPLFSVSDPLAPIGGAFWGVEGDARAVRLAKQLVRDLGGESFSIRSSEKPLYHAAAVMTSGSVTALFDVALEMLVAAGLARKTARRILQPLLASTVQNLETKDPSEALTGTFSRGDLETVKRHLAALKQHNLPDALNLYRLLGERSLKMTKKHPQLRRLVANGKF